MARQRISAKSLASIGDDDWAGGWVAARSGASVAAVNRDGWAAKGEAGAAVNGEEGVAASNEAASAATTTGRRVMGHLRPKCTPAFAVDQLSAGLTKNA
jgi:hypothetical protein